jgi:hypothetical protein
MYGSAILDQFISNPAYRIDFNPFEEPPVIRSQATDDILSSISQKFLSSARPACLCPLILKIIYYLSQRKGSAHETDIYFHDGLFTLIFSRERTRVR